MSSICKIGVTSLSAELKSGWASRPSYCRYLCSTECLAGASREKIPTGETAERNKGRKERRCFRKGNGTTETHDAQGSNHSIKEKLQREKKVKCLKRPPCLSLRPCRPFCNGDCSKWLNTAKQLQRPAEMSNWLTRPLGHSITLRSWYYCWLCSGNPKSSKSTDMTVMSQILHWQYCVVSSISNYSVLAHLELAFHRCVWTVSRWELRSQILSFGSFSDQVIFAAPNVRKKQQEWIESIPEVPEV